MDDFCIRPGYEPNLEPAYFADITEDLIYQPHVYELALFLADRCGATHVIDVGCGAGGKLAAFEQRFQTIGIDHGANLAAASARGIKCIAHDLESGLPEIPSGALDRAIVICADVVEHLVDPSALLHALSEWARVCPYVLISTPDRVLVRGIGDLGPPANPAHVREWAADEFDALLTRYGFASRFLGHTINTQRHWAKTTLLAIAGAEAGWQPAPSPRILAIINVYNEADMINETLDHLLRQGVDALVIDNWSTDRSFELVTELAAREPRVKVQRFPEAPGNAYEWKRQLQNVEHLAAASEYDWILHNDADELRYAPWHGRTLAEAIAHVDARGYNAIDFTVVDFRFLEGDVPNNHHIEERLRHFEFGRRPGHFVQIKAWRQPRGERCQLAASGGHEIHFAGRRVFPLKFLVKHYPLRSREQAKRKIFRDRLPRAVAERVALGWHTQYDQFSDGSIPAWQRARLIAWSDHLFAFEYLVERLSGIGIEREETPTTIGANDDAQPPASGRVVRLLQHADIENETGLEIGPLDKPLVERKPGRRIYYLDYAPRDTLRHRSSADPRVDGARIPEIDFVTAQIRAETFARIRFDYVLASHVVEHLPDMLGALCELLSVLTPDGRIILAVPDCRYTFDYLRPLTTLGQLMEAQAERRTRPAFGQVYDGFRMAVKADTQQCWRHSTNPLPLEPYYTRDLALRLAKDAHENGGYHDCHCWVFTYESFLGIVEEARALKVLPARVIASSAPVFGANEFHVVLRRD